MSGITADSLTTDEPIASRSRTFTPEVVKKVHDLLNPPAPAEGEEPTPPARNVGIGTFDKEGAARSTLASLNRLLHEQFSVGPYASTVRQTDDGKYKGIMLNKSAKKKPEPKPAAAPAAAKPAPAKK